MAKTGRPPEDPYIRLAENMQVNYVTGCWNWTGWVSKNGYGKLRLDRKLTSAHKAAYFLIVGDIEPGKEIHHTCGNRPCCNPSHLVCVTRKEHRNEHLPTECAQGHPYVEGSFVIVKTDTGVKRDCLICRRLSAVKQGERRKALRAANPKPNANAAKTHCPRGHEYNDENTGYDKNGGRFCIACKIIHNQNRPHKEPKLFCKWNHARTPENTYTHKSGKTECKPCMDRRLHEYRERKRLSYNQPQNSGPIEEPKGPES